MTTNYLDMYIHNLSELEGKTIKKINTGFCDEGLYIITEDGKWTLFSADEDSLGNCEIEIVTNEKDIESALFKGDYIVNDLDKHTSFDYEKYKKELLESAQKQLELNREKHKQEEIELLKKLLQKYGN